MFCRLEIRNYIDDELKRYKTMKNVLGAILFLCSLGISLQAQEANKFRFDIQLGLASALENTSAGVLFNLEPKYTLNERMNVGLRLGVTGIVTVENIQFDDSGSGEEEIGANISYLGTFDYYFHKSGSSFAPFVGAGVGFNTLANIDTRSSGDASGEIEVDGKVGGMLRVGFDWFKFRLSAEYNIIPNSDLRDLQNNTVGTSQNSYFGVTLGFYFGGGKWKRS